MTKEEILDKHYEPRMHWKSVNRSKVLAAMEEYREQGWVRVEDGLPEVNERVLVWAANLYVMNHVAQGLYDGSRWFVVYEGGEEAGTFSSEYISHWMPLPEPPKD